MWDGSNEAILEKCPVTQEDKATLHPHCLPWVWELLISTTSIVGGWKEYFEDLWRKKNQRIQR